MAKKIYPILADYAAQAFVQTEDYANLYRQALTDPEIFWGKQAEQFVTWFAPWQQVKCGGFSHLDMQWFYGGKLNVCYNCLDRHLPQRANKTALIWQGDDPKQSLRLTYSELHRQVCQFANALKQLSIQKGDRVCIYLPMVPEALIAMLACARIGAVHSVVFGGFSSDSLKSRILAANCKLVITADEGVRGGKLIPLKANSDTALIDCPTVQHVIVVKRTGGTIPWSPQRDCWYHEIISQVSADCPPEWLDAQDPLFILYTSGSTGKPKGILHTTGGYLVYVAMTFYYVFNYQEDDIHWCTADVGWITGHSYVVYGPLCNGATTLMFEGVPHYPSYARFWEIIDHYQVNIFYTAPTAIRALRHEGDAWVRQTSRQSLKLLGTVGEPINPEVWEWYFNVVGNGRCPIVDTWWQTETGGILITSLPGATPSKPGKAGKPFFGIVPAIVNDRGEALPANQAGKLVITQPWPGLMATVYADHQRFIDNYFQEIPGAYLTGDGAYCDEDGYYCITGRNDDVIKIAGHRIGTQEVESAFLTHPAISEAAVVAVPDEIKGQSIYAFVTVKNGIKTSTELKDELIATVRKVIGAIATPKFIQWAAALPKTRSGKIMRRILRKIANDELENLGDLSTLADAEVVEQLLRDRLVT